jgi:hypothetical protein
VKAIETSILPPDTQKDAQRVLKILARWDEKMRGRQTQKRSHERCAYPARMAVFHHEIKASLGRRSEAAITVWARNVSALGVGFIYKGQIPAKRIVMCLDPDTGAKTWLHVEIVRRRKVHNEFWDYGAKFVGRATPEDAKRTAHVQAEAVEQVE